MLCALRSVCSTVTNIASRTYLSPLATIVSRQYAVEPKKVSKGGAAVGKQKTFDVETDPVKLVNYVCGSNIYKEGQDVELKPESEYPEWLWSIRTGPPPKLHELDPTTKEYWLKVRVLARRRKNRLLRLRYKVLRKY